MTKDKLIISKLFAIAEKQQKTLTKLAQTQLDPNVQAVVQYLKNTWQTAALNSGIVESHSPEVSFNPGTQHDGLDVTESYTVKGFIPEKSRETFNKNFYNQIKSQKPELEGKVSAIFNGSASGTPITANVDSNKLIEKLISIAEKQQKIINKLAQTPTIADQDTVQSAQQAVQAMGAKGYKVLEVGSGAIKIQCPLSLIGSPANKALKEKLQPQFGSVIFVGV